MTNGAYVYAGGKPVTGFNVQSVRRVKRARIIGAPVEDGTTSFDNKVNEPDQVVVRGVIEIDDAGNWRNTIATLELMVETRQFIVFSVSDGVSTFKDLMLEQFPHERDCQKYDWISCELVFKQRVLVQTGASKQSSNKENASTRNTGYQNGVAV